MGASLTCPLEVVKTRLQVGFLTEKSTDIRHGDSVKFIRPPWPTSVACVDAAITLSLKYFPLPPCAINCFGVFFES